MLPAIGSVQGDILPPRVRSNRAFLYTGVDFTRAVEIRTFRGRGPIKTEKLYLELVIDMSATAEKIMF